jgi:hypothetical protein
MKQLKQRKISQQEFEEMTGELDLEEEFEESGSDDGGEAGPQAGAVEAEFALADEGFFQADARHKRVEEDDDNDDDDDDTDEAAQEDEPRGAATANHAVHDSHRGPRSRSHRRKKRPLRRAHAIVPRTSV